MIVSNTRRNSWARKSFLRDITEAFGGVTIDQVTGTWLESFGDVGEEEGERFTVLGNTFEQAETFFAEADAFATAIGEEAFAATIRDSLWSIEYTQNAVL